MLIKLLFRTTGLFFILLPFLPIAELIKTEKIDDLFQISNSPKSWALSTLIVFLVAWLMHFFIINFKFKFNILKKINWHTIVTVSALLIIIIALYFVSKFAFQFEPLLIDNIVQLFQAKIFASGNIVSTKPELFGFFVTQHMLVNDTIWTSQYPPGWSILLAIGYLFNSVWIIPILLSFVSAIIIYFFVNNVYGKKIALVTLVLLASTPFFLFIGATYTNHVPALFFIALFVYFAISWEQQEKKYQLLIAAFSLAFAIICRPLTAFIVGLALGLFLFRKIFAKKNIILIGYCLVLFCIPISLWLTYNYYSTGSALNTGYTKLWGSAHGLGFHESPWGFMHTPFRGISFQLANLYLLQEFLFESALPSLFILGLYFLLANSFSAWDLRLLLLFFSIPFVYIFYWHTDAYWGPRYIYCSILFLLPLTGKATYSFFFESNWKYSNFTSRYLNLKIFICCLILVSIATTWLEGFPRRFGIYTHRLNSWKVDLQKIIDKHAIKEGLIFIPVSWGNRIISNLRELGVEAALVEKAYRSVDSCRLDEICKNAMNNNIGAKELSDQLITEINKKVETITTSKFNTDPTLRINPKVPLTSNCIKEIDYDNGKPFYDYSPFLIDNDPFLKGSIIVARDLRARNLELMKLHSEKQAYILLVEGLVYTR